MKINLIFVVHYSVQNRHKYESDKFIRVEKQFEKTNTTKLLSVAADGIAERIENKLAKLSANDFETFVKWHLSTCEHPDHQGLSAHNLYICKKIK